MTKNDKARSALLAVFPTFETFVTFSRDSGNLGTIQSFVDYAVRNRIIDSPDQDKLRDFIRSNAKAPRDCTPPKNLSFGELFEKKEDLLELHLSARTLTGRINSFLAQNKIDLPKVSNSMLTRLKREPADTLHKQNALRSIAFWIGHERAYLDGSWNFETLMQLCSESGQPADYKEGVRMGFALYSRGDVVDHEIISWLKKHLKECIEQSAGRFLHGRWGKVRSHDITTLYVDLPKEEEVNGPASYRQCLTRAVSLAHQMAVRWALSRYGTQKRFLSIGIAAGEFAGLDKYLLPILNAKLPADPVIRVIDYVRQCLLINDIRAELCCQPFETTLFNGETLNIWWIVELWTTIYFDFVPGLLGDKVLQNNPSSVEALTRLLWPPVEMDQQPELIDEQNAVTTFFTFPHNSLLGLEIAKTLYYRRRFWEALEIIRIVLSLDPTHLNARTFRMLLFRNLALDAQSWSISENLFKQAEQEALYIQEHCTSQAEDFYCEYAGIYLAKAMLTLRYMRKGKGFFQGQHDIEGSKKAVFLSLDKAEELFRRGMTVSPSALRSGYLLATVKVLDAILRNDEEIFINSEKPVDAKPEVVMQPSEDFRGLVGYRRRELPKQRQHDFVEKIFMSNFTVHDDSISLQAYRPTTYFCMAVAWWDCFPVRTVGVVKRALQLLNDARDIAQEMEKDDVCIYSFTRTYGEMMPAAEFVRHMKRSIQMIEDKAGRDLFRRNDAETIGPDGNLSSILLTLNF